MSAVYHCRYVNVLSLFYSDWHLDFYVACHGVVADIFPVSNISWVFYALSGNDSGGSRFKIPLMMLAGSVVVGTVLDLGISNYKKGSKT